MPGTCDADDCTKRSSVFRIVENINRLALQSRPINTRNHFPAWCKHPRYFDIRGWDICPKVGSNIEGNSFAFIGDVVNWIAKAWWAAFEFKDRPQGCLYLCLRKLNHSLRVFCSSQCEVSLLPGGGCRHLCSRKLGRNGQSLGFSSICLSYGSFRTLLRCDLSLVRHLVCPISDRCKKQIENARSNDEWIDVHNSASVSRYRRFLDDSAIVVRGKAPDDSGELGRCDEDLGFEALFLRVTRMTFFGDVAWAGLLDEGDGVVDAAVEEEEVVGELFALSMRLGHTPPSD
jgi:hypothetical protein